MRGDESRSDQAKIRVRWLLHEIFKDDLRVETLGHQLGTSETQKRLRGRREDCEGKESTPLHIAWATCDIEVEDSFSDFLAFYTLRQLI
jgi:hypothetical protein